MKSRSNPQEIKKHLWRSFFILILSIAAAAVLFKSGIFDYLLTGSPIVKFFGNFVAGLFFTSVLTTASAALVLSELAQNGSLLQVALIGAAGAVIGDFILFRFVKERITDDFIAIFEHTRFLRLGDIFKLAAFHWALPFLGFLIVASPLPDEIGLAMMGIAKIRTAVFVPLSFVANFTGIITIGLIARSLI